MESNTEGGEVPFITLSVKIGREIALTRSNWQRRGFKYYSRCDGKYSFFYYRRKDIKNNSNALHTYDFNWLVWLSCSAIPAKENLSF